MHKDIEQMAGQRLMVGFEGISLNQELKYIIGGLKAGGIILFRQNIKSRDQVASLSADVQAYAKTLGQPPLFIAVDQEGGVVARLKAPFTEFKGNPHVCSKNDARHFASVTARELSSVGINMNMAPVMDVVPAGAKSIMEDRAFKGDFKVVSDLGSCMIQTMQEKKIMAVAKHFPGIGRTIKDSHHFLPRLDIDLATLEASDIKPFEAARDVDVTGIMLSHIFYPQLDDNWQASLSPFIVRKLLRKDLGYDGLIMTDDLDMKAISHDIKTCIRQILISGVDLALICHQGPNIQIAYDEMVSSMNASEQLRAGGQESLERILRYKGRYLAA